MATTSSQVKTVLDALAARLALRAGLSAARVFTYVPPPSVQSEVGTYITLAVRVSGRQEYPYAAKTIKRDRFTIDGEIIVLQPGAGDEAAAAAMTLAESWFAEIEDEVRTDPSLGLGSYVVTQIGDYEHLYSGNDRGRIHGLRWSLDAQVEMVST
ncbi:MAG TPA: hypothetical protein PK478_02845 [Nitrospira sp.]|jgi:hypothetical protein|nr:hypothetical protein [Nitrospira sp.]HQW88757.1 hypothetical protein [Nitrospira sp.]HQZ90468.1 hypothetical protein [Thermomicrobiales bacterium]HRA32650.1 hypothetical protein [Thermomicrobiales bacterium]